MATLIPAEAIPALSAAVTLALLAAMLALRGRLPLDRPNQRSLHRHAVPRSGGIAIMAGAFCAMALVPVPWMLALPVTLLFAVSLADDLRGVPSAVRFAVHAIAAAMFAVMILADAPLAIQLLFVPVAVWMTNLYNFMDGADGLAGGMTAIGFGALGAFAWSAGDTAFASLALALAASGAGFLAFNVHPARIFMGDAGSIPLGFLAAALGAMGWQEGLWPVWFAPAVFAPFIADASATLARRMARRERFWEAHFDHYYQRLVRLGWGHRRTALAAWALMAACAVLAWSAVGQPLYLQLGAGGAAALGFVAIAVWIDRAWHRHSEPHD